MLQYEWLMYATHDNRFGAAPPALVELIANGDPVLPGWLTFGHRPSGPIGRANPLDHSAPATSFFRMIPPGEQRGVPKYRQPRQLFGICNNVETLVNHLTFRIIIRVMLTC